jgi:hypothetical protein
VAFIKKVKVQAWVVHPAIGHHAQKMLKRDESPPYHQFYSYIICFPAYLSNETKKLFNEGLAEVRR